LKPTSVVLLLFACVVAGLSGAILYNYLSLNLAKAQLVQLEANSALHDKLINEPYLQERAEVERRQVKPSQMIASDSSHLTEKHKYLRLIIAKIQQNWFVDDSMRGKECKVNIRLQTYGALESATVIDGDYNLCAAAMLAINKSAPFSMPSDPVLYDQLKNLTFTLQPEFITKTPPPKETVTASPYKALQAPFLALKQQNLTAIEAVVRNNFKGNYPRRVNASRQCRIMANYDTRGNLTDSSVLSGGDYYICTSAQRAISDSVIVPMASNPEVYDSLRNITFTFTQLKR
jgi:TolA C-terminal